jgi:hypothetical protein
MDQVLWVQVSKRASLTVFLTELEHTVSRLRSLNVVIEDNQIITKILLTVPAELKIFEVALDITPEADKTLKNFTSRLIKLDKNIKMRKDEEKEECSDAAFLGKNNNARAEPNSPDPREEAMPAQKRRGQNKGKGGGHSSRQPPGGKRECWECGDTSHVKAQCRHYKRRREKEEEERAYRKRRRHDDHDRRGEDRRRDRRHDESNQKDYKREGRGYSYKSSTDQEAKKQSSWYADSGATQHMTDNRAYLSNFVPTGSERWTVSGIGETNLTVAGQGDVALTATVNGKTLHGTMRGVSLCPWARHEPVFNWYCN